MPTSLLKKMGLGSLTPTIVVLQLADRSLATPNEIIEHVLVQVRSLIFLVDFIILDFIVDPEVPFVL